MFECSELLPRRRAWKEAGAPAVVAGHLAPSGSEDGKEGGVVGSNKPTQGQGWGDIQVEWSRAPGMQQGGPCGALEVGHQCHAGGRREVLTLLMGQGCFWRRGPWEEVSRDWKVTPSPG